MTGLKFQDILDGIDPIEFYEHYINTDKVIGKEHYTCCPFHTDDTASFSYNAETGQFHCFGCSASGHFLEFVMQMGKCSREDAVESIRKRYSNGNGHKQPKPKPKQESEPSKSLDASHMDKWEQQLWDSPPLLNFLRDRRGLTDETIRYWQIGYNNGRYILPIFDADMELVNVRSYLPDPPKGKPKWQGVKEHNEARLFPDPINIADAEHVLVCEGELDAILAIQKGYCAITGTGGAETWKDDWSEHFKGKVVTIAYDNDSAGREGAVRVAESLAPYAAGIRILEWPDILPEKGDVTDFFVSCNFGKDQFEIYLEKSRDYVSAQTRKVPADFKSILPKRGFLASYVSYASDLTDAPQEFHLATGLSVLAAACGNRVTFRSWGQDVCLHLWTILIAPSGFYRKSTSMNIGLKLLSRAMPDAQFPNDFSREQFLAILADKPAGILPAYEFKALLDRLGGGGRGGYMDGTIAMLTELYDSPDEYSRSTRGEGTRAIKKCALNILGASTVRWMKASRSDLEGGFLPRFLPWSADKKTEWKGMTDMESSPLCEALVDKLKAVSFIEGKAYFPPEVKGRYNEWIRSHEDAFTEDRITEQLLGYWTRMATYTGKFAVLCQIALDGSLEVSHEALSQAIRIIEFLKARLIRLFKELTFNKDAEKLLDIRKIIERYGSIEHSALLRESNMIKAEFDKVINTLLETRELLVETEKTKGRPRRCYTLSGQ